MHCHKYKLLTIGGSHLRKRKPRAEEKAGELGDEPPGHRQGWINAG
jgi:hypothetical protein